MAAASSWSRTEIHRFPAERCDLCNAMRELTDDEKQELIDGKVNRLCLLCAITDYTSCSECFFKWSPRYFLNGRIDGEQCDKWVKLEESGQHVCSSCVAHRECGLDIMGELSDSEKAKVVEVKEYTDAHGKPMPELIMSRTIPGLSMGSQCLSSS